MAGSFARQATSPPTLFCVSALLGWLCCLGSRFETVCEVKLGMCLWNMRKSIFRDTLWKQGCNVVRSDILIFKAVINALQQSRPQALSVKRWTMVAAVFLSTGHIACQSAGSNVYSSISWLPESMIKLYHPIIHQMLYLLNTYIIIIRNMTGHSVHQSR
jgi:hypothetical protein